MRCDPLVYNPRMRSLCFFPARIISGRVVRCAFYKRRYSGAVTPQAHHGRARRQTRPPIRRVTLGQPHELSLSSQLRTSSHACSVRVFAITTTLPRRAASRRRRRIATAQLAQRGRVRRLQVTQRQGFMAPDESAARSAPVEAQRVSLLLAEQRRGLRGTARREKEVCLQTLRVCVRRQNGRRIRCAAMARGGRG